jgi:hypothetical protein
MRKCVGVLIVLCLMASSVFATNTFQPTAGTANWGYPPGSADTDWSSGVVPANTEQVKIKSGTTCNLNTDAGTINGSWKVTVGTATTAEGVLNVVSGGALSSGYEFQVGDSTGYKGRVTQTGGAINLANSASSTKLEVGYKAGIGYYTISGGSITGDATWSQLLVGAAGGNGGTGTFTVDGTGGSISVSKLYIGASTATAQYTGTGNLAFDIDGGVSAINAGSVYIDPTGIAAAVANLYVTKTGALPTGNIILINNTGTSGVTGAFDNIAWGSTITLGGIDYTLTKTYIGGLDGLANDVALLIPEPATIALLGLGLLALRRNKK